MGRPLFQPAGKPTYVPLGTWEATASPTLELGSHVAEVGPGSSLAKFKWKRKLNQTLLPIIPASLKLPRPQLPSYQEVFVYSSITQVFMETVMYLTFVNVEGKSESVQAPLFRMTPMALMWSPTSPASSQ